MMRNFCARKSPAKVAERSELEPWHSEVEERPWFVQRTGALLVASASSPSLDALQASAIGCCQETQEVLEPSLHLLRPPTIWRHCRMQKKKKSSCFAWTTFKGETGFDSTPSLLGRFFFFFKKEMFKFKTSFECEIFKESFIGSLRGAENKAAHSTKAVIPSQALSQNL